ncbi:MAG TPA: transposase [Acidobacteriota bacterium]|nr:transposase [Acidobacteriota bacterium]
MRRRQTIVEPVFGQMKHDGAFQRWMMWGLEGAQLQWALLCVVHNLKKLLRLWQAGALRLATG